MKLGMIARGDNTGLGNQCVEFYRHLRPERTLLLDFSHQKGLRLYPERYRRGEVKIVAGRPTNDDLNWLLQGCSVVYTAETAYNQQLYSMADWWGVRTILHYNYEFLDHLHNAALPRPSVFATPTRWNWEKVPFTNKTLLPFPIALNRFEPEDKSSARFLHVTGKPAIHDRNGTELLLKALRFVRSKIELHIATQDPQYVMGMLRKYAVPHNVKLTVSSAEVTNYWDLYKSWGVLVMPRRYGGLCLPVQEAIGAGMAVIMSQSVPNGDWLPPECLVPARYKGAFKAKTRVDIYNVDVRALAMKMDELANPVIFGQIRDKLKETRELWSWDTLVQDYRDVIWGAK